MFTLAGVAKVYSDMTVLGPLTLTIPRGDLVAVVGPSGSGKTTLLHVLGRIVTPDQGELTIDGRPAGGIAPGRELSRLVGVMHQQFDLVSHLPVVHNVLAGCLGEWSFWRALISLMAPRELPRASAALTRVGIPEKLYERTAHLSGGEQQRVALARLLVQRPRAILADEPVSSLDPARAADLITMLVSIAREGGHTLVVSLHSLDYLHHFNRVIALRRGQVHFDRPAAAVSPDDLAVLYAIEEG